MNVSAPSVTVTTQAPAKAILLGEHAVNRGQPAVAVSVGLHTTCRASETGGDLFRLEAPSRRADYTAAALREHAGRLDAALAAADFSAVARATEEEFFASSAYVLGRVLAAHDLPGLCLSFDSRIPASCGLGSGGAAHAALALALREVLQRLGHPAGRDETGPWAWSGDRIAHGGTASGLDTQTSLLGGVIEYRDGAPGRPLGVPPGLRLVIGHSGVAKGSTGSVNARIRAWLAADPGRQAVFERIGRLTLEARAALLAGDWAATGRLMDANHALLAEAGASHPQLERLVLAARQAGAYGAKLTGAGGGGVMIALVSPATEGSVAAALQAAGGTVFVAPCAVPGARVVAG